MLTFCAVAHRGSFSHAARDLALSQPAVSHPVAQLERELGAVLPQRRPRGRELIAEGHSVLEHADVIAERLTLAQTQVTRVAAAATHG